ncbi:MAG: penicillin-binding transpeptidase domain-containing protein [Peptostreptococcaceae bacterium]|nr:penicillin-binding transpeptidase domain-containing protein [Peptostreptococcaceae bacterium]
MASNKFKELAVGRIKFVSFTYIVLITILIGTLGYLQVISPEWLTDKAVKQQQKDAKILPQRGMITDRNGKILAVSIKTYDIMIEVREVKNRSDLYVDALNKVLGITEAQFMEKFNSGAERFYIAKNVPQEKVDELKEIGLGAMKYEENAQRLYPLGQFASHVLGHVSSDNYGQAGIEYYFDKELRGVHGRRIVTTDKEGREVPDSEIRYNEPLDGYNITLTIEEVIQRYVEKVTQQALIDSNAVGVTSIVMQPKTGEILAMASKPDYDPQEPRKILYEEQRKAYENAKSDEDRSAIIWKMWRNPAVNNMYEPGSTFKLITAATAIEQNLVRSDEQFYDPGYVTIHDRTIKNWTPVPYGRVDFRKATVESINTVFVEVGNRIGGSTFLKYVDSFGFGSKTGIEISGEEPGLIFDEAHLRPVELATMSYGQGITVTPIQLIAAVSAIANEGKLVKPTLVREISTIDGQIVKRHEIEVVKNPISSDTASKVMDIMESVGQAASRAQIEGYRVAGKSGTAQKVINGDYGAYIGSFVGIVPVEDPQLVVLVIVDQPRSGSTYGGAIAAPVVKQIMEYSLRYLGINPDGVEEQAEKQKITIPEIRNLTVKEGSKLLDAKNLRYRSATSAVPVEEDHIIIDCFPAPGEKIAQGTEIILYLKNESEEVPVPDLKGKTIDEAGAILDGLGLKPVYNGVGLVKGQSPEAGKKVKVGSIVSLDLSE